MQFRMNRRDSPLMYPLAEQLSWNPILPAAMAAVTACVIIWALWAARWRQGRPVAPYQPRRPVPWHGLELALVVVFYLVVQSGVIELGGMILGADAMLAPAASSTGKFGAEHVVGQLVAEGNVWILALCVISAAVVAPISEEFFFRLLLQGWLETLQRRWRRDMPTLQRLIPNGAGPIMLTSLLFARLHFRVDVPQVNVQFLVFFLAGDAIARVLTLAFAVELLRRRVGATAADLGWAPQKVRSDVKLGLAVFAAVAAPIYAMQLVLHGLLPESVAPDPLPLFFLALALGILYYRTHSLVPSIVLHAALNGTSLVLAWLAS